MKIKRTTLFAFYYYNIFKFQPVAHLFWKSEVNNNANGKIYPGADKTNSGPPVFPDKKYTSNWILALLAMVKCNVPNQ